MTRVIKNSDSQIPLWAERNAVEGAVRGTRGVWKIDNRLRITRRTRPGRARRIDADLSRSDDLGEAKGPFS